MNTPELDRAIVAACVASFDADDTCDGFEPSDKDRIYARTLIASVWEQIAMARTPCSKTRGADYNAGVAVGFMAALLELRKFSIVEGEG